MYYIRTLLNIVLISIFASLFQNIIPEFHNNLKFMEQFFEILEYFNQGRKVQIMETSFFVILQKC